MIIHFVEIEGIVVMYAYHYISPDRQYNILVQELKEMEKKKK